MNGIRVGKAHVDSSGGVATVTFDDFYKQGEKLSLAFGTASKEIRSYDVITYLVDPKDVVTLNNQFASLTDGTNYHAGNCSGCKKQTDSNQNHTRGLRPIEPLSQD